jgi:hypothetical protein
MSVGVHGLNDAVGVGLAVRLAGQCRLPREPCSDPRPIGSLICMRVPIGS